MYTCCPICKTNFKVTEAQLQVAQGKVRCGSCKNVFNARQHIHYKTLTKEKTSGTFSARINSATTETHASIKTQSVPSPATAKQAKRFTSSQTPADMPLNNKTEQTRPAAKQPPTSDIDAIFNALDSQLTSGTYQDIAKPAEKDIREADFDENLEEEINNDEPDLDLYISSTTEQTDISPDKLTDKTTETQDAVEASLQSDQKQTTPVSPSKDEEEIQQHAFEFKIPNEETALKQDDKIEVPSTENNNKPAPKVKNAALHEAIDNIIKVDNNIPTPFDEHEDHKDDHFVIEMQTEPDVELVNEDDIDKLFASTDSLNISDLKFNKLRQDKSADDIKMPPAGQQPVSSKATEDDEIESVHDDFDADNFNQQVEEQLNPDSFSSDSIVADEVDKYEQEKFAEDFDADEFDNQDEFDELNADEEIILSTPDEPVDIPHRLRDAVASLNQQTMSLKSKIIYISSSFLLIVLLFFQLVLFKSTTLANSFPALQPLLLSMCDNLPCRYTGNHNSKRIKIISRDVRLHPRIKGALLISATIVNQADYQQPYPTIQLKFTDLTGATVAQRYFQPDEYLGQLNKPFALMPAKQPVQLNIEILDPGSDAINFQFFFL